MNNRKIKQFIGISLIKLCVLITVAVLGIFLFVIFKKGIGLINIDFLTLAPKRFMTQGGIYPAIVGTFWLTSLSIIIALPVGILTAIYLTFYANKGFLVRLIRVSVNTLAGVPSVVYGLFGLAVFVRFFNFDVSILSGSLTLAILVLPVIINNAEEAILSLPKSFTEASLALGATKRQTVLSVILPAAAPNILTATILSIGRVAGETAPILFTAATFYTRRLPKSIMNETMALPYHIYALLTEGAHPEKQVPIAYATAVVLLLMVLTLSSIAVIIRYRIRKKRKW